MITLPSWWPHCRRCNGPIERMATTVDLERQVEIEEAWCHGQHKVTERPLSQTQPPPEPVAQKSKQGALL